MRVRIPILLMLLTLAAPLFAKSGPVGVGVVLGAPTGVSAALDLNKTNSIQGSIAWSFTENPGMTFTADYLYHFDDLLKFDTVSIPVYLGVGGKIDAYDNDGDDELGLVVRVPLGARWVFKAVPVEAFFELVPGLRLVPKTRGDFGFGLGARWYF